MNVVVLGRGCGGLGSSDDSTTLGHPRLGNFEDEPDLVNSSPPNRRPRAAKLRKKVKHEDI